MLLLIYEKSAAVKRKRVSIPESLRLVCATLFSNSKSAGFLSPLTIAVAFTSLQKFIWNRKFYSNARKGISPKENINKIIEYSTLPGTSRHHWGTDIDIIDGKKPKEGDLLLEEKFHENGPYVRLREWMEKNANRFGFYLPYTNSPKREGFNYEPWHYSFAPLSIPMLEEYLKLDLINLLTPNDLSGKSCIDEKFLESYINQNVLGINPKLKDF